MAQRAREDRDTKRRTREDTSEAQMIAPEQRSPRRKKAAASSSSSAAESRRGPETSTPADREGGVPEELNPDDFE